MTELRKLSLDFNDIRKALVAVVRTCTGFDQGHVIMEEPEIQDAKRPSKPYVSLKITSPATRYGDDDKRNVKDDDGNETSVWNSGGPRKMSVDFNAYGNSHEESYNVMALLQAALDLEDIQEQLRRSGIAVWIIGNVADLSQLLNTGYEGRAHMDCQFGIAVNISSDLGSMDSVGIHGEVNKNNDVEAIDFKVP